MKIEGKVATIIYKNETNGWTVLLLKVGSDYVTATGETENIEVEDKIELDGEYVSHKVYGEQFKFDTYVKVMPKTSSALIDYISSNIKGVGKKTAERIVKKFDDKTIDVIRFHKEELEGIKGLNEEKILAMSEFFNDEWDKWNVIEYLSQFSISVMRASKIYKELGTDTILVVKENPYSLLKFIDTLDFKVVDDIGKKQGISLNDKARLDAGVIYSLTKTIDFGHTCIEYEELVESASKILEVDTEEIKNTITRLCLSEQIYIEEIQDFEYVFRRSFYIAEQNIASSIINHSLSPSQSKNYKKAIDKVSDKNGLCLSEEQIDAITNALNNKISIITGGPGTGKTTIIKCIIDIIENMNKDYVLCAPTGRAAKRITETTGKEAKTLHRLLEITKVNDNDFDSFLNTDIKEVKSDYIIVDESSMIDIMMMNNLLKAVNEKTSLIFVGDVNQLPSVGPGNILKDIIDSGVVKTTYLKEIYRQSEQSDIILNAHRVNSGQYPEFKSKDTDFYFIPANSIEDTKTEIKSLVSYRLSNFEGVDISKDIQILTPMKKTELGAIELNKIVQEIINPKKSDKKEKEFGNRIFRTGDKVMQIVNNYDKKSTVDGVGFEGVYNGDMGYIIDIDFEAEELLVKFEDDKVVSYSFDEAEQLEHAYAVTVHKSQGSEFDYVVLPLFIGYKKLFTRNLLYTAITRAKKMLIIVGNKKVLNFMVDNIEERRRKTGLKDKLIKLL